MQVVVEYVTATKSLRQGWDEIGGGEGPLTRVTSRLEKKIPVFELAGGAHLTFQITASSRSSYLQR